MTGAAIITQDERRKSQVALKRLSDMLRRLDDSITKGTEIRAEEAAVLAQVTGTDDRINQLAAIQQAHDQFDAQYDEELRFAAQFKFSPFCEYMFRTEIPALHHEFLIDYMERVHQKEVMRLAISMPPGSAKSSYASQRFAAWHLGRRPNDRWLQGAHSQNFAKDRLGKPVRSMMQDARYKNVFPEFGISTSSAAADFFEFSHGRGYYKAVGVGTGISGYRADIAAIDDPIASREDAESETLRKKLHMWYQDDFGTRPMPGSPIFVVLTRWHEDDLIGHELQKMKEGVGDNWDVINIPALALYDDPLGREPGEGLWPELFGTAYYEAKRRNMTARSWNSLYQGNPIDDDGGVLRAADIHRYKVVPKDEIRGGRVVNKRVRRITLSVDCAEKATQRSDYTAATVWMEDTNNRHYMIHATRTKKEFSAMSQWIDELAEVWDCSSILVEDRGAGTQYVQVRKETPGSTPVIPIATKQQSKEFRFDGVTPMFASGQALLPEKGVDWIADVEGELLAFPNGRNDDYVDSVSQYLAYQRNTRGPRGVRKLKY